MIIDHSRDKLMNAIIFFSQSTNYCGKIKLYKLLYFLDFEHYKQTGRSVTGMEYSAWPKGPLPRQLDAEFTFFDNESNPDISITSIPTNMQDMLKVIPKHPFDPKHITKREFRIMKELAGRYKEAKAKDMIEATHLENEPWHEIYVKQGKRNEPIPYELALREHEKSEMLDHIKESEEFWNSYQ